MHRTWKLFVGVFIMLFVSSQSNAQDPAFSQFYANPIYLNPQCISSNSIFKILRSIKFNILPEIFLITGVLTSLPNLLEPIINKLSLFSQERLNSLISAERSASSISALL